MAELAWTAEQVRAITAREDALLSASAGTGKTTTIVARILWLLGIDVGPDEDGRPVPPCPRPCELREVAAITFTEKAAFELKSALRAAIRESDRGEELAWEVERASVGTIHSFCAEILREGALRFGIDPGFRVLDEREARAELDARIQDVVLEALEAEDEDVARLVKRTPLRRFHGGGTVDHVRAMLRDLRWHGDRYRRWTAAAGERAGELDPERLRALAPGWDERDGAAVELCAALHRLACRAADRWQAFQETEGVRDFDSLVLDARDLLASPAGAAALARLRRRYRILIIDEFQDTDGAQRDIAFAIAGLPTGEAAGRSGAEAAGESGAEAASPGPASAAPGADGERPVLFLVGDPKQSIYRFRGADISVWNEVRGALCGDGDPLRLTRNFRSRPPLVAFVNRACEAAMEETGRALEDLAPGSRVRYTPLVPALPPLGGAGVEWLPADARRVGDRRDLEAELVARRIRELAASRTAGGSGGEGFRYRDMAILYRSGTGLDRYERALQRHGIPFFSLGTSGFAKRQEVLDLITALRLVDNPRDDLRAFAYLRSPFVGLRDEVLARIRLEGTGGTLLRQAARYLECGEWFPAPEDSRIVGLEREGLARGLGALDRVRSLAGRLSADELVRELIEETGYRVHLRLLERGEEALANVEKLLRLLEEHRHLSPGAFLEAWDRWDEQDTGIPQAPLYSREDEVVTVSSIHRAKGLEWPVVFFVDTGGSHAPRLWDSVWSDPELGPLLCPKAEERGPRSDGLHEREIAEGLAEEARLLYVAATRAQERLVIAGPWERTSGHADWLARGRELVEVRRPVGREEPGGAPAEPDLPWMDDIEEGEAPPAVAPVPAPPLRFVTSATERMRREAAADAAEGAGPSEWEMIYRHGVLPLRSFAPRRFDEEARLPASVRGEVVHGVLERVREEAEIAALLEEVVQGVDAAEADELLGRASPVREELEREIGRVVAGEEWRWYVEGREGADFFRELAFAHLAGPREWFVGALDLYRPGAPGETDRPSWIVDFKTHRIGAGEVEATAAGYAVQARVYRRAAGTLGGPVRFRFHFTHPNRAVDA